MTNTDMPKGAKPEEQITTNPANPSERMHDGVITVGAEQTLLQALEENGIEVPYSCESGTCGTCRCHLRAGEVDHRDLLLSEDEQDRFIMPCVSRGLGKGLVIGLLE